MNLEVQIKKNKIFAPIKDKWLLLQPEEKVRQEYICHLVNHYGFSLKQMGQEQKVNNSKRGQQIKGAINTMFTNASSKISWISLRDNHILGCNFSL